MKFRFRRRSEFEDLLEPRRRLPGWLGTIIVLAFFAAAVWYLFSDRTPEHPSPPPARPPVLAPETAGEPAPPEPVREPEPAVASPSAPSEKPPPKPEKAKPVRKQSDRPAPKIEPNRSSDDMDDEQRR